MKLPHSMKSARNLVTERVLIIIKLNFVFKVSEVEYVAHFVLTSCKNFTSN